MAMKFKAFLFDLDGTLVDSEPLKGEALSLAVKHFGGTSSASLYKDVMGESWEVVTSHFLKNANIDISLDEFDPIFRLNYERLIDGDLFLRPHLVDFLEAATEQNIKMALVSSASRWMIEKILDKLNLNKYFDLIISKEDVSKHKPDPEAFLLAIRNLDVTHKQTLVFEDSEAGVKAAQAAGCSFVFVRHDFNSRYDNRNSFLTIDTFADLQKEIL